MLLLCYMTSSVSKSFIFFFVLYNPITYDCNLYNYPIICIIFLSCFVTYMNIIHNITLHSLSKSKNKEKKKIKINIRELNRVLKYNVSTLYTLGC